MLGTGLRLLLAVTVAWTSALAGAAEPMAAAALPPVLARGAEPIELHGHLRSFIDQRADRSIDQVEAQGGELPWRPRRREQADRLGDRVLWITFDVQIDEPSDWFLELGAAGIDRVQLFHRDANDRWVVRESGDAQPMNAWPVPGRFPTFSLSHGETGLRRFWLRVEHTRLDFAAPLTIYREDTLLAKRQREQFLLGAYFGIAFLLTLAALGSGLAYRDRAFLAFALYTSAVACGQLARAGIGAQHVWPEWPFWNDLAVLAWPGLPVAAALWFVKVVTESAHLSRALDRLVWALIVAVLLAVAVDAIVHTRTTMVVVLVLTGFSLAAVVAMVVWGWLDGRDPALRLVALGFVPVVALAFIPLARGFNLLPISDFTRYAIFIGTGCAMPLLYYALQVRSLHRRESEVRAAALSHTDALTGLPHRRALVERLDAHLVRARSHHQQCALLAVRVANLDAIADEFGREAADKALVVAAASLRGALTEVDMAARVGEREFAVLLDGPITAPEALSRAQQVVAGGLRHTEALPVALTLRFHVTVALLPHHTLDGLATVQWALEGLSQISPDAKKLIRPLNFATA